MADNRPRPQERKLLYIAPLIIGAVILAVLVVIFVLVPAAKPPAMVKSAPPSLPYQPTKLSAAITAPPPVLTRKDLIEASRDAAARYAAGAPPPSGDAMAGRRFSVRIPFACNGIPDSPVTQVSLSLDAQNNSVTLAARPGDWTALPVIRSAPEAEAIDSASGFWIPRPWRYAENCPARHDDAAATGPASEQTLGLVQISGGEDSRVGQHGDHAYEYTRKLAAGDAAVLGHAYRLVLEGRIATFANGQSQHCWAQSADQRPVCLLAVSIDHVAFEDSDNGKALVNWTD